MMIDTFEFSFSTRSLSLVLSLRLGLRFQSRVGMQTTTTRWGDRGEGRVDPYCFNDYPKQSSCFQLLVVVRHVHKAPIVFFSAFCRLSPLMPLYRSPPPPPSSHDPHVVLSFFQHAWKSRNEKCFVCNFSFHLFLFFCCCCSLQLLFVCWTAIKLIEHELLLSNMNN